MTFLITIFKNLSFQRVFYLLYHEGFVRGKKYFGFGLKIFKDKIMVKSALKKKKKK